VDEIREMEAGMTRLARACTKAKPNVNPKAKRAALETEALTRAPKLLRAAKQLIS
jgi:hypothetical protein